MKDMFIRPVALCLILLSPVASAQTEGKERGIVLGIWRVQPAIEAQGAYDSRAISGTGDTDDIYGQMEGSVKVDNTEARLDLNGWASYGYRSYNEYSALNDDFYGLGGKVASNDSALKLALSGMLKKTLSYDVQVDDQTGDGLGAILTPETSMRSSATINAGYEKQLTDKSALMPAYEGWYYHQDFESQPDAEWQEHGALLQYGYILGENSLMMLTGGYGVQLADEENGSLASVSVGAESRVTDKIKWAASMGFTTVDYELSGRDQGIVGDVSLSWQATDKVGAYVFGGNGYQPGYGGSEARRVYRAGYGVQWGILSTLSASLQILHDYQEGIQTASSGGASALGDFRHFFSGRVQYDLFRNVSVVLSGQYTMDEEDKDRSVIYLGGVLSY